MTVGGCLSIQGTAQIQHFDNAGRPQIEVLFNQFRNQCFLYLGGAKGFHHDRYRLSYANGVSQLNFTFVRQAGSYDVFSNIPCCISTGTVNFCRILTGECAAAMASHAAIGINDNLPSRQAGVALRAAHHKTSGGVDIILGLVIQELSGHNRCNDMLAQVCFNLLACYIRTVLCGNNDSVNAYRYAVFVFHGDLGFAVRTQIVHYVGFADFCKAAGQPMRQSNRQRHKFWSFVRGIAEHHALVASANGFH